MKKLDYSNAIAADPEIISDHDFDAQEIQDQFDDIFKKIRKHPETEDIRLEGNGIRTQELNKLAQILSSHNELKVLDLSNNSITLEAIPAIKKIIETHSKIRSIYLDFNKFKDEFINTLINNNSDAFNKKLKSIKISLSNNNYLTVKSIDDTENKLSIDSRLTMLVGNHITRDVASEYRKKIMTQAEELSVQDQSIPSSNQTIGSDKLLTIDKANTMPTSTPFTPQFKDSSSQSSKRKSEDSPEKLKIFEELNKLDPEELNAAFPGIINAIENSKKQKVANIIKSNG